MHTLHYNDHRLQSLCPNKILCTFQKVDPETGEAIDQFLLKLKACATGESPFTFVLDDTAGNSYIENP